MYLNLKGYKLCKDCGAPMLKKGQKQKHPDDYRHAQGCRYYRDRYGEQRASRAEKRHSSGRLTVKPGRAMDW
jgi:hypothetical protein